jgi:SAM-dependent methyltransferase
VTESAVQNTRATYDEIAGAYLVRSRRQQPASLVAELTTFCRALPEAATVADIGCGPGNHTTMLRQYGIRTIGVDLSAGMLRAGGLPDMVQADMRALPIRTGVLDGIWSRAALLHVPRTLVPAALAEFGRAVRVGGALHLTVAEGDGEGWQSDAYDGQPRWYTHHREDTLRALLLVAGFTTDSVSRRSTHRDWLTIAGTRIG